MKTIGLLGGMAWPSTVEYYRQINQYTNQKRGDNHSAECLIYSVDFQVIENFQHNDEWDKAAALLIQAAQKLEMAGADMIVICTNTMHLLYEDIQSAISIPVIHIAEATGESIKRCGLETVGLLGTRFTMEKTFYSDVLTDSFGIETLIPEEHERMIVHDIIYSELVQGTVLLKSKEAYLQIISLLIERGAQGIILGCTEIPLLVKQAEVSVPLFDTTLLHAKIAVDKALENF